MSTYKLTYFNAKARGEVIRWLLSYSDKKFEDVRIGGDKWIELKKDIQFGKLPVLEIDGKTFYQSMAISRYLAEQAKLTGDNSLENYEIERIVGSVGDFMFEAAPLRQITGSTEKEAFTEKLKKETLPPYLKIYDELAQSGYLANGKLSWADIHLVSTFDVMDFVISEEYLAAYPNLVKLKEKVVAFPGIKRWIASRS